MAQMTIRDGQSSSDDVPELIHYPSAPSKVRAKRRRKNNKKGDSLKKGRKRQRAKGSKKQSQPKLHSASTVPLSVRRSDVAPRKGAKGKKTKKKANRKKKSKAASKTTWKSEDHQFDLGRRLKKTKQKKSMRYDESFLVQNETMQLVLRLVDDMDSKKNSKAAAAKLSRGRSLLGDEMKALEMESTLEALHDVARRGKDPKGVTFCPFEQLLTGDHDETDETDEANEVEVHLPEEDHDEDLVEASDYLGIDVETKQQLKRLGYSEEEIVSAYEEVVDKQNIMAIVESIEEKRDQWRRRGR